MENSKLYDLLEKGLLAGWKEQAEKDGCVFTQGQNKLFDELTAELSEKGKKLLTSFALAVENKMDYIYYNINIKILNYGIKLGIDLQKAFTELE